MDISTGLIAKAGAGTAALAATTTTGIVYKDTIAEFFVGGEKASNDVDNTIAKLNEKLVSLGLPSDCVFEKGSDEKNCEALDDDKLKAIKFDGRNTENLTITGASSNLSLKIRRDSERDIFTEGIKIIFEVKENVTISGGGLTSQILFRKGTNPEFKIKDSGGATIVKAWNAENLAKKINLTCPSSNSGDCGDFVGTINVFEKEGKKIVGATATKGSSKVKFENGQRGYNQGIRFLIEGGDVNLSLDPNTSGINSLPVGATYEIKQEVDRWYLKRVWDMGKFVTTVGFKSENCTGSTGNAKICTLSENEKLNIDDGANKVTGALVGTSGGKIKVVGEENYNLGFKLTIDEKAIEVSGGNASTGSQISSLANDDTGYEMKFESGNWFLTKKPTN